MIRIFVCVCVVGICKVCLVQSSSRWYLPRWWVVHCIFSLLLDNDLLLKKEQLYNYYIYSHCHLSCQGWLINVVIYFQLIINLLLLLFQTVRKMEAEVVQMCVNMFKGGKEACGTVNTLMTAIREPMDMALLKSLLLLTLLLLFVHLQHNCESSMS